MTEHIEIKGNPLIASCMRALNKEFNPLRSDDDFASNQELFAKACRWLGVDCSDKRIDKEILVEFENGVWWVLLSSSLYHGWNYSIQHDLY